MPHTDREEAERRLWDAIETDKLGMLGLIGGEAGHFQPMTAFWEEESRTLWFFSYGDTDLGRGAQGGAKAMFTFVDKGRKLWACVGGELHVHHDPARIDRFWNAVVAAWYPQGKDDPRLTLLHLKPDSAEVWINEKGPLRFAWEVLRANMTHSTPDPGRHEKLQL